MNAPTDYERGVLKALEIARATPPTVHIYHAPYYNQRGALIGHTPHGSPVIRLFRTGAIIILPSPTDCELVKS